MECSSVDAAGESCSIYVSKPEDDLWSHIDSDSLSVSGSEVSCSIPIPDRKARHKIIERNRRDKTRLLVEQLQAMLPNIQDRRHNPNINHVLQHTLEYLHSTGNQCGNETSQSNVDQIKIHVANIMTSEIDDITRRKYLFSFDNAPFGIVISRTDGALLRANRFFRNMFCFPQDSLIGQTMFTLTSNQDLAITMKVRTNPPPLILILQRPVSNKVRSDRWSVDPQPRPAPPPRPACSSGPSNRRDDGGRRRRRC